MRDSRINMIIEGTSDIMHLFIAREALDAHMRLVSGMLSPQAPLAARLRAALVATARYAAWYPLQWLGMLWSPSFRLFGAPLAGHLRFVHRQSHRLARELFHAAMRYQTRLAYRQELLGRLVDIGGDLFAMAAACAKAHAMVRLQPSERSPVELADLFCREARRRISSRFHQVHSNDDRETYRLAQDVQNGRMAWLEEGIV
jgi:hypothetical protein